MREARDVFFVDGIRTPFGKAGPKGQYWRTRADDLGVKAVRELLRRNPQIPVERIGDVAVAATAQVGDQGLTLGRDVALLAGLPESVPGFAVDRMCAGARAAASPRATRPASPTARRRRSSLQRTPPTSSACSRSCGLSAMRTRACPRT